MNRQARPRIAIFANNPESLVLEIDEMRKLFHVAIKHSKVEEYLKMTISSPKIIVIKRQNDPYRTSMGLEEMIKETNLTTQLKKYAINQIILPHSVSEPIEAWASANDFSLIAPQFELALKLENKIIFSELLKNHQVSTPPVFSENELKKLPSDQRLVVQEADNFGLLGTSFFDTPGSAESYIKENREGGALLIRGFLEGIPVGVTLFMDPEGNYFYSALRRQCYLLKNGYPQKFTGIQWLPHDFFPDRTNKAIEETFKKCANIFRSLRFFGSLNIDLIVHNGKPYVLECNPRLSSASAHLFSRGELTGESAWAFFRDIFKPSRSRSKKIKNCYLPASHFEGALLDIDIDGEKEVHHAPRIGTYRICGERLKFIKDGMDIYKGTDRFFLFHDFSDKKVLYKNCPLATIISNSALFKPSTGELNERGELLYRILGGLFFAF